MKKIIAATRNEHKIREMNQILRSLGMSVVSRDDAGIPPFEIDEDGDTFEENSFKKANEIMLISGQPSVADDSGLVVDWLDGAPGVFSARFAGDECDDNANNQKLLQLLEGVPYEKRTARFVCVMTLVYPDDTVICARGECPGHIADQVSGRNGFGYDPLFIPDGYDTSFGHVPPEEKNRISHRGKALRELVRLLEERENGRVL